MIKNESKSSENNTAEAKQKRFRPNTNKPRVRALGRPVLSLSDDKASGPKATHLQDKEPVKKETQRREPPKKDGAVRENRNNRNASRGGKQQKQPKVIHKTPVRIIPLGGLHEIGKNITAYECGQDMFLVDCGLAFPDADMLGVDLVIPDFTYLEKNKDKIRGLFITHGHEDHIGAIPYLLKKLDVPIYGTRLSLGLIEGKLKEHGLLGKAKLNVVTPRQTVKVGCMAVEFVRVNHSIPLSLIHI